MKYNELIKNIAEKVNMDEKTTKDLLNVFLDEVTAAIAKGEEVQLWGFGKFERRKYNERQCYNPITKEIITLHGSYAPVFKAGVKLRKKINE